MSGIGMGDPSKSMASGHLKPSNQVTEPNLTYYPRIVKELRVTGHGNLAVLATSNPNGGHLAKIQVTKWPDTELKVLVGDT